MNKENFNSVQKKDRTFSQESLDQCQRNVKQNIGGVGGGGGGWKASRLVISFKNLNDREGEKIENVLFFLDIALCPASYMKIFNVVALDFNPYGMISEENN